MAAISTAFRAFFQALFNQQTAARIAAALEKPSTEKAAGPNSGDNPISKQPSSAKSSSVSRSEALAYLELLQREARFVDFLMENVEEYSDEQVGAAARDLHRSAREVTQRIFSIEPISAEEEGSQVEVPADYSAVTYRLIGNVSGSAPYQGELLHHGWQAKQVKLPKWTGDNASASTVSPVEVELK